MEPALTRRLLLILITTSFSVLFGQKLYWVGGSGNWNDGKHWSLTSGGSAALQTPGNKTDVVFDVNSGQNFAVSIIGKNYLRSISFNTNSKIYFNGESASELIISGNFNLNSNINFDAQTRLVFNSDNSNKNEVHTGFNEINCDLFFESGKWQIAQIMTKKSVNVSAGEFDLENGFLSSRDFIAKENTNLNLINSSSVIRNKMFISKQSNINAKEFYLKANTSNSNLYNVPSEFSDVTKIKTGDNNTMACGVTTLGVLPTCPNLCDGVISFTLDAACIDNPYFVSFPGWPSACTAAPSGSLINGPTTFSIGGLCKCGTIYQVAITDAFFNVVGVYNFNFAMTDLAFTPVVSFQPSCFAACNGTVSGFISGGTGPYTATLSSTSQTVATGAGASWTNLCASPPTHTVSINDNLGCAATSTFVLTQPALLVTNGITSSVACNGNCTGSVQVSPTGGTAGYTVNWSTGSTVAIGGGGSSSITNLCIGNYSASITDTRGCIATYSANITQPSALTLTPTQTNVSCGGLCNASASVNVTGGTAGYTYTWTPAPGGGQGTSLATGLCGTLGSVSPNHTVSITDANGCVRTQTFNITQPPPITLTPTFTNAICNGSCNGTANANESGGTGVFTYTWIAPGNIVIANTKTVSALCAGLYTINVTDAQGCTATETVQITQPPAITLSVNSTSITCFGLCNGTATANISGGTPGYNFTWTPAPGGGQGTGTVTGLCPNNFTLNITDLNNCPRTATFSVTQPSSITPNITTTTISCSGVCDGVINSNPTGGTGPYSYTLASNSTTLTSNPPFNALCASLYTLTILDAAGCSITRTVNLVQPNTMTVSVSTTSISCFGFCNASLSSNVIGGTPAYTFTWTTPSSGTLTTANITNQCAGTYTLLVRDQNGCTQSTTAVITQPTDMTVSIGSNSPLCFGQCNGSLTSTVTGGTPAYSYNWTSGSTSPNATGLCAGTYTLVVTDFNGCIKTTAATVAPTPSITISTTVTPVTCAGNCDGVATATATGGTPGYTYQWNTLPIQTAPTATGLCTGNFVVTVTDNNGCINSAVVTVTAPLVLSASITSVIPSCNICIGSATVTGVGGTPAYSYTWTNSGGFTVSTSSVATGLCVGNYTVTIRDASGCTATTTVTIPPTVIVVITSSGSPLQCNGVCTGTAVANPIGGTPPYSYSWTPTSQTTQTATGLCAGTHTVRVTDNLGCSNTNTITFTDPPAVTVTATQGSVTCNASCNGSISVNASGGTGALSFSWAPGNPTGQGTGTVTNLCAGIYTLNITDANNCLTIRTFTIDEPPPLTATFTQTDPSTCSGTNGTIIATPSGGTPGYSFTWTPSGINSATLNNVGAGTYSLLVVDAAGCTATVIANLSDPTGPTVTVTSNSVTCNGLCNGSATVTAVGSGVLTYSWMPPVSSTNTVVNSLCQGTFVVNVTDGNNCITSSTVNIAQPTSFSLNPNVINPACSSVCSGSITTSSSGGTPAYSYTWLPGSSSSPTLSNICAGVYTVNVLDANNCAFTQTFNVTQPTSITVNFTKQDVLCNAQCNGSVQASASGGTGPYSYTWTPVGTFVGSPLATIVNLCPNIYTVTVTDFNGCTTTATVQITEPTALTSTLVSNNATCNGSCNGSATLTTSGGTPTYTFSWSGSGVTTSTISGLCAGNYSGTVTDANGCTSVQSFSITQPAFISVTLTPTQPLCNAACNGSISSNVSGGTPAYSYTWIPAGGNGPDATALCAGNYTLMVSDLNSCTGQGVIVLINPPALLANVISSNPSCSGVCNGTLVSSPVNGSSPYTYTWSPGGQTTQTITGLCAGIYSVNITDNNNCTASQQVTLTAPSPIVLNPAVSSALCGVCNGSISLGTLGGTPAYSYTWTPFVSSSSVAVNLCAGLYTVNVSDANGCVNSVTVPLSNANGPNGATVTFTDVTCNNLCNGVASVTNPVGGTPGYTVTWVVPSSTVMPLTNLCAGNYTSQITDANNCILFVPVTISQPPPIVDNAIITNPLCNGVCTGSINVAPSGGTPGYSYSWSTGATTSSITNLCTGNYSITITDNNNCTFTTNFNLPGLVTITANTFAINNNCFGQCTGNLSAVAIAGGLPPYSYNWNNGQTVNPAINLCNGNYYVIITDQNGCFDTIRGNVISPAQITLTSSIAQPSCGLCNGTATVSANGGTGPYTYTWSGGSTGSSASNLCAGLQMVTVVDNLGCLQNINLPISNSNGITGENINTIDESCAGQCNGSATVTAIGGTPPISYSWISPVANTSTLTNLCSGTYFIQMTDAQNCIRTTSVTINPASSLTITPFLKAPDCGVSNGSIIVTPSGGTGPYTYTWSPTAGSTPTLSGLGSGTYSVTVTDALGCSKTEVYSLINQNAPTFTFNTNDVLCNTSCTGGATVVATSGVSPFTFTWSVGGGVNTTSTSVISGLCSGVITVTVTGANGCSIIQNLTITEPPAMVNSLPIVRTPRCNNDCDGSITLVPSGGTLPYTYSWTPSATVNPITSLCAGNYTGVVTDANGCSLTSTVNLINPPVLTLSTTPNDASCNNTADGAITTTVGGGIPAYTYTWTGPGTFTSNSSSLSNILPGTYTLSLEDLSGCRKDTTIQVISTITVTANAGKDSVFCQNGTYLLDGTLSSGATTYEWVLISAGGSTTSVANTVTASVNPPVGTSTFVLIASNGACFDTDTVNITSNAPPLVDAGPNYSITIYSSVIIGGSPTGPSGSTYSWTPSLTLNDAGIGNPLASNTVTTIYTVTVMDQNGCMASDTMVVYIYPEIFVPNGFSPNADGKNDLWIIDNIEQFPDCTVEVFNRWGESLFFSKGYGVPWNGRFKGKDLPVGTYYYIINLNHPSFPNAYTGPLTIFR